MNDEFVSTSRADKSKKYLLGKNGWIFLDHDSTTGLSTKFSRAAMSSIRGASISWRSLIAERDAYVASIGAQHLMFVAPNKELVYSEQLPDWVEIAEQRPIHQIMAALGPSRASKVIYPLDEIRAGKAHGLTYPKTDTHWSGFGAYIGYLAFCNALSDCGIEPLRVERSRLSFEEVPYVGDLGIKFEPPVSAPTLSARIEHASW